MLGDLFSLHVPAGRILITDGQIIEILLKADRLIACIEDRRSVCECVCIGKVNVHKKVKKHIMDLLCMQKKKQNKGLHNILQFLCNELSSLFKESCADHGNCERVAMH